jgi:putative transposase
VVGLSCPAYRYTPKQPHDNQIKAQLQKLAEWKPRRGFGKFLPTCVTRAPQTLAQPEAANQCWSLDFMGDSLAGGRALRTLNIVDDFNREVLWI